MSYKKDDNDLFNIGSKVIDAGVNLENQLVELLKVQIKTLRALTVKGVTPNLNNFDKINSFNKSIIMALMLADDQIKKGIDMCQYSARQESSD